MTAPTERTVAPGGRVAACAALLLLGVLVAALGDPTLNSGSDAGGKTATVTRVLEAGLDGGDLGYWAEAGDPAGVHHPFIKTSRTERGWVQATSSIMPLLSAAGATVAGGLGALWLSLAAVPLGALAAARLSRGLGSRTGALAFVVVGAASPLTFYGADQWEHAPALAAGLWAVVLLREKPGPRGILLLGVVSALAVVLRREVGLFLIVAGIVELVDRETRGWWMSRIPQLLRATVPALGILSIAHLLDGRVLGTSLAGRSGTQATQVGSHLTRRAGDAVRTTIALDGSLAIDHVFLGVALLGGVALAARGWKVDDPTLVRVGAVLAAVVVVARVAGGGLGFVPGAFAVLPLTATAPVLAGPRSRRLIVSAAGSVVVILALQWTGSLAPPWGGRYLLLPAAVVAVVAATEIERRGIRHPAAIVAIGSTAAMAALGLAWHVDRTSDLATSRDEIIGITAGEIVISTHSHFPREIASDLLDERWLLADTLEELPAAFDLVEERAPGEPVWLLHSGACPTGTCDRRWEERDDGSAFPGWRSTAVRPVPWLSGGTYVLESFVPR